MPVNKKNFMQKLSLSIRIPLDLIFTITLMIMLLHGCANKEQTKRPSSITTIYHFAEIPAKNLDSQTLLLLDIDNTIFKSATHYGSVGFFIQMVKDEVKTTHCTESEAKIRVYDRWIKSQQIVATTLVDKELDNFLKQARSHQALIIAFTARQPQIAAITAKQIKKHNISLDLLDGFNFTKTYTNQIYPDPKQCANTPDLCANKNDQKHHLSKSIFYRGILFAHDLNEKGKVFIDFYKNLNTYRPGIKKIVFVDDSLHNLESIKNASAKLGLEFYGYHIKDDFTFDPDIARREEARYVQVLEGIKGTPGRIYDAKS